jgi:hypothetical protein
MGGFLSGLLLGFPRIEPSEEGPETWSAAPVVLPEGWQAIEIDRIWVRDRPMRLVARQGERTRLISLEEAA